MNIEPGLLALAAIAVAAGGFLVGRLANPTRARIGALQTKLETAQKERELAQASLESARAEIERARAERERYGQEVVDHFQATSDLMRDLTVQYRAVYDQLTRGATTLCPEGSVGLQSGLAPGSLATGEDASEAGPDADAAKD